MHNQIHEFQQFIPVTTPLGDGYLLMFHNPGPYSNGIYGVVLCTGKIRWFTDDQFTVVRNDTTQIFPQEGEDDTATRESQGRQPGTGGHAGHAGSQTNAGRAEADS